MVGGWEDDVCCSVVPVYKSADSVSFPSLGAWSGILLHRALEHVVLVLLVRKVMDVLSNEDIVRERTGKRRFRGDSRTRQEL